MLTSEAFRFQLPLSPSPANAETRSVACGCRFVPEVSATIRPGGLQLSGSAPPRLSTLWDPSLTNRAPSPRGGTRFASSSPSGSAHGPGALWVLDKLDPGCGRLLGLMVLFSRGVSGDFQELAPAWSRESVLEVPRHSLPCRVPPDLNEALLHPGEAGVHAATRQRDLQQPGLEMARNNFCSS